MKTFIKVSHRLTRIDTDKMKLTKLKIILSASLALMVLGVYIYHLEITKPYRVAQKFLDFVDSERYTEAIKMIDVKYARPIVGKDGRITGVHFEYDWKCECCNTVYHSKKDIYFAELKDLKVDYRKDIKGIIKRNLLGYDMYERGFLWLEHGYSFWIEGGNIEFINGPKP